MAEPAKTETATSGKSVSRASTAARRATAKVVPPAPLVSEPIEAMMVETAEAVEQMRTEVAAESREIGRQSLLSLSEMGQVFTELANEQSRHGFETARALASTVDWSQAARIQGDFLGTSAERMLELMRRYLEIVQATQMAFATAARGIAAKASIER